ncbi:MAG: hypothetical protein L6308_00645, partial [Candidatus Omnitrophica bacterium]|nr:hypothetical protein [Candidatus Omnitrophota bacterium]
VKFFLQCFKTVLGEAGTSSFAKASEDRRRAMRKPEGLKPPDCDCWVGRGLENNLKYSSKQREPEGQKSFRQRRNVFWRCELF